MRAWGQGVAVRSYRTSGKPSQALVTADGRHVLVTVNTASGAGIDVFEVGGTGLKKSGFQRLKARGVQGIVAIAETGMLAVGLTEEGVGFLSLEDTLHGKAGLQVLTQGEGAGTGYLAASADGQFLFAANEYGEGGNVGVIALHPDKAGGLHPETVAHIPTARATPGIALSGDGKRLYAVGEIVPAEAAARLPGHGVAALERSGCVQANPERTQANGVLYVIDVAKAEALAVLATGAAARAATVRVVDAGCSPVRETESADGATVYITARGDDAVLAFDVEALRTAPAKAFLRALPTKGAAPVGVGLMDGGKTLVVANSNRFAGGSGTVVLLDAASGAVKQVVKTGEFPRNITVSADGKTAYVTVFTGGELLVVGN